MDASQIGKRAWSYAGVLQDAGLSCFEYVEQLTLLLFLKMADQLTEQPHNKPAIIPASLGWKALLPLDGAPLEDKYREILEKLTLKGGMLGVIFKSARCEIHNPALLKQLIVNLIDKVDWLSLSVDFVQHIYSLLKINGRAAVVVPDNVLFEGGAGEKVRRNLLEKCRVHTLLRLRTGIWYSPGVKANVIFFEKKEGRAKPWTDKLWVYDLRTNKHFTLKQSPIQRTDFDEFVDCYKPGKLQTRKPTWTEYNPEARWRCYDYEELLKRDKLSLDLFWIKDQSLTDTDKLPAPDILATEIADDLEAALELFTKVAARLAKSGGTQLSATSLGIDAE